VECRELRVRKQEEQVEQKPFDLLSQLIILVLVTCEPARAAGEQPVTGRLVHGLLPAIIADPGA